MTTKILLAALLLLASLSIVGFTYQARPQRVQWEYKQTCNFRDADKLGADGWELVTVAGGEAVDCFYFKRQK